MNKKYFLHLMVVMMAVILYYGFVSCSKDDGSDKDCDVVGTWIGYACVNGNTKDFDMDNKLTLVFKEDGSGEWTEMTPLGRTVHYTFYYKMESSTKGQTTIRTNTRIYFEIVLNNMNVYEGAGFGSNIDYFLTKQ